MSWTKLLASKEAQRHKTSKKELDNMRALIARDLADAAIVAVRNEEVPGRVDSHPRRPVQLGISRLAAIAVVSSTTRSGIIGSRWKARNLC